MNKDVLLELQYFFPPHRYLHVSGSTYGRPIQGQFEISAVPSKSRNNQWKAMEGVYMEPVMEKL